ncbi:MAG: LysR family transcriptional regulator [Hydrogenophaga sp.]|uniref:LysR family transcriptional regulator n=1 Tax=Hydrogenophaga sp. TaxID=1904254 RepID=UPI001D429923|nr:LysR family transcriptional regulator [Hydrogenophaga sp.]MBX3611329.1 LysR family transcriptional regulator [Hydrogenophaga sp.]
MKNADLRQLALLCELIDTQSLNEAASRLHMSPSAASHALTRLRQELGDELCVRDRQGYQLTPRGASAQASFRQMLDLWRESSQVDVLFDPASCEARVTLACCEGLGVDALAAFHRRTVQQAPRLQLDIDVPSHDPRDIEALRNGTWDILCGHHAAPTDARDLYRDAIVGPVIDTVCLRSNHPRIGDALSLAQYLAEDHVSVCGALHPGGSSNPIDDALAARGLPTRRVSAVKSWLLCAEWVAHSDRLLTISADQAVWLMRHSPLVRLLPLPSELAPLQAPAHLLWHQRTHQSRPHRWLRQRLREHFNARPAQ